MEIRPDVGASLAAGLAHEARFQIGEPDVIRPLVRAIAIEWFDNDCPRNKSNQEIAHAGGAHFSTRGVPSLPCLTQPGLITL